MKKILVLVLALMLALGTCSAMAEGIKIGCSIADLANVFYADITDGMKGAMNAEDELIITDAAFDQAKQIALAQVPGASTGDIREFEVDHDDGRLEYEGTILYGEMEYEFEIDGYSGAIRSWEVESIHD